MCLWAAKSRHLLLKAQPPEQRGCSAGLFPTSYLAAPEKKCKCPAAQLLPPFLWSSTFSSTLLEAFVISEPNCGNRYSEFHLQSLSGALLLERSVKLVPWVALPARHAAEVRSWLRGSCGQGVPQKTFRFEFTPLLGPSQLRFINLWMSFSKGGRKAPEGLWGTSSYLNQLQ